MRERKRVSEVLKKEGMGKRRRTKAKLKYEEKRERETMGILGNKEGT